MVHKISQAHETNDPKEKTNDPHPKDKSALENVFLQTTPIMKEM